MRAVFAAAPVLSLALALASASACSTCGGAVEARCNVDADCAAGSVCTDGVCQPAPPCPTFFADADGDGFGDAARPETLCAAVDGFVVSNDDCDDGDSAIHPGADDVPADGIDQDCDGADLCFADADGDGAGGVNTAPGPAGATPGGAAPSCDAPGTSSTSDDCDDADAGRFPGNREIGGDGIDQDCNGVDDCFLDVDGDTFGGAAEPATGLGCNDGVHVALGGDCNDNDAGIHPGANDAPADGIDQDCDGRDACFVDNDGDGFGVDATVAGPVGAACGAAGSHTSRTTDDCDDTRADVHPGAAEIPGDGSDGDCDGHELCFVDNDGDGVGGSATTRSVDIACAGIGLSVSSNDCNDTRADISPRAAEIVADGIDQDCDGVDACFLDADGDGFGSATVVDAAPGTGCGAAGTSTSTNSADCDDANALAFPNGTEVPADGIDGNCDGQELCFTDADGDGFGNPNRPPVLGPRDCIGTGIANNSADCDDTVPGANGQACDDANLCTNPDICSRAGSCVGINNGTCACSGDCATCDSGCCKVACPPGGDCPCTGCACAVDCHTSGSCNPRCTTSSCNVDVGASGALGLTCDRAVCEASGSAAGSATLDCQASVCGFDVFTIGSSVLSCDNSLCTGTLHANGFVDVQCTNGAECDMDCVATGSCALTVDAASRAVFTCSPPSPCNITCPVVVTDCGGNVHACNRGCP